MTKNDGTRNGLKIATILLVAGLALTALVIAAPEASATCIHQDPANAGIVDAQAGDCATYVIVLGDQVYP